MAQTALVGVTEHCGESEAAPEMGWGMWPATPTQVHAEVPKYHQNP
eukprot:CAMPEP_0177561110 /NCGR_PEP_ID=MMETSP0369-20130122/71751_1 /TAXON_ID=447022 ORGANISM="Scrippsiella hangoei-like, Strain SHHI-4" /NCGR_SAMPLE_ID=MMETSP0369 /ASSEMBLY_ACC=CAM_ASM_000364 /LENGTH=45 /DNA_ID= /DNA_START= /DNA_END= /DNA_ORIENTATION=